MIKSGVVNETSNEHIVISNEEERNTMHALC